MLSLLLFLYIPLMTTVAPLALAQGPYLVGVKPYLHWCEKLIFFSGNNCSFTLLFLFCQLRLHLLQI
jgi:hypothetical protein